MLEEVVPYIGTWIETNCLFFDYTTKIVVPYIGTWIETITTAGFDMSSPSYLI